MPPASPASPSPATPSPACGPPPSATPGPAPASGPAAGHSPGAALELLVHGVGGATPQDMLDDPRTVRVSGDETAAMHRRTEDRNAEKHPERFRDGPVQEAYCWSGLTSGNGTRALWLLLLPFMVVNLAHWMRPPTEGRRRTVRLYGTLVRLLALSLTVLLTASVCEVALDLTAWQCAGSAACAGRRSWLGFLAADQGGWWSQPGRRLALAALVPTLLVWLLWYLSNRTWSAYEAQRPPRGEREGPPAGAGRPPLGRPGFWYGRRLVARLRAAHTAAGFLTVAAAVGGSAARHDRLARPGTGWAALGWLVEALLFAGAVFTTWVVCRRGRSEQRLDNGLDRAVVTWLPAAALALLALTTGYAAWSRPGWRSSGTLPGDATFGIIAVAQGGLVLALGLVALRLYRSAPHARTALYGLGGPAVAMLACALGGVMAGGVAQRVADWLDGAATPGMGGGPIAGPPVILSWQASVIPVLLILLLAPAAFLTARTARRSRALAPVVESDYPGEEPDRVRTRRIASARARAALTDTAPVLVGLVSAATLLLGAGAVAGALLSGTVPGKAFTGRPAFVSGAAQAAQALGSWLIGFGFILFVTWGRRAYKDASARRTIGILWDVGTFWPRAAHPFAPPCYAERAVPDLAWRMSSWTGRTGGRLVISGHSQGSVLAAAAVWQLPEGTRRRVALLTYGSPLERLYGRWFPAYFGPGPLGALHRELHCWRNLWRRTDPIGGPVQLPAEAHKPEVDHRALRDPVVYGRTHDHPLPEPILGHSDYQADPVFAKERAVLLDRLPPALPLPAPRTAASPGDPVPAEVAVSTTGATPAGRPDPPDRPAGTARPPHRPAGGAPAAGAAPAGDPGDPAPAPDQGSAGRSSG